MQIQCTQCAAKYVVPDNAIGEKGRTVRCAKCAHSWFVAPMAKEAAPLPGIEKLASQATAEEAPQPAKPRPIPKGSNLPAIKYPKVGLGVKIATGALSLAAILLGILVTAPGTYGYPRSKGFALAEVNMISRFDDKHPEQKHPTYEITGKIINTTDQLLPVPVLRISVVDKSGETLQFWDFSEKGRTLEAGKNIPFSSGPLNMKFNHPEDFVVELGSPIELSLRHKP